MRVQRDAALKLWATLRDRLIADVATLPDAIDELSAHVCTALPISGAGLLIASDGQNRAVLGASDDRMRYLERLQATFDEGPCMDAVRSGRFCGEPDLQHARDRWPSFAPPAIETGIKATFSFPVHVGETTLGALDCYRVHTGALTPTQVDSGELFANIGGDLLMHAQAGAGVDAVIEQLTLGDAGPQLVEQASGIVAYQLGISTQQALKLLRGHARSHDLTLEEVAVAVTDGSLRIER